MKHVTKLLGLGAMAAIVVGFASPAQATPAPPNASSALLGTWVNTNGNSHSVKKIVVVANRAHSVSVDAFGACTPTLCEWGTVPAITYGANVSAATGGTFQSNQRFLSGRREWSRTTLLGSVSRTKVGLRLSLRELTVFLDGSGRKNYTVTETFKRGLSQRRTLNGHPVTSYLRGNPPALIHPAFGSWKNIAASGGLAAVKITGSTVSPIVQAFGQCSPTACDMGRVRGITYGRSISTATGSTVLAPYKFGFKNSQLVISYSRIGKAERLTIYVYSEFTDASHRSNYVLRETMVRA
ncbi:MAG: hypothetical protein DLM58_16045 [Pseudonocardiales bacterium]|nr:MAG: hypothetical protein DLM58_16045 [Pseudonocardiales bacterium]